MWLKNNSKRLSLKIKFKSSDGDFIVKEWLGSYCRIKIFRIIQQNIVICFEASSLKLNYKDISIFKLHECIYII